MIPVAALEVGRDEARELARDELSRAEYKRDDPGLVQRIGEWLQERLMDLVDSASGVTPGGWFGVLVVIALIAAVVAVALYRTGGVRRTGGAGDPLLAGAVRTAADHRAEAEAAAAAGRFDLAVRERLRAVARELETRGFLDPRPGRTADELARDGGRAAPPLAAPLRAAALAFDDVWYGGRTATSGHYATVVRADELVATTRPGALAGAGTDAGAVTGWADVR